MLSYIKLKQRAFTLIELLLVIVVIGIITGIAIPNFVKAREHAFENEARASLRLIIAAQRSRRMETNNYYTSIAGATAECPAGGHICNINAQLRLLLPDTATRNWNYITTVGGASPTCAAATRNVPGGIIWRMRINFDPVVGNCP